MGALDDLYSRGCGDVPDGALTPSQALAGIRTADRLAAQLHRSIEGSARPAFVAAWRQFYNQWLTYRTLQAERLAQTDPATVMETDLPRFVRRCYEWRDAFHTEGGRVGGGQAVVGGEGFTWRPVVVLGSVLLAGILWRWWSSNREKERERQLAEAAERERARMLPAMQPAMMPAPYPYTYYTPPIMVAPGGMR